MGLHVTGSRAFLSAIRRPRRGPTGAPDPNNDEAAHLGITDLQARLLRAEDRVFLVREYRVRLSVPKIYEILAEKYVLRSK